MFTQFIIATLLASCLAAPMKRTGYGEVQFRQTTIDNQEFCQEIVISRSGPSSSIMQALCPGQCPWDQLSSLHPSFSHNPQLNQGVLVFGTASDITCQVELVPYQEPEPEPVSESCVAPKSDTMYFAQSGWVCMQGTEEGRYFIVKKIDENSVGCMSHNSLDCIVTDLNCCYAIAGSADSSAPYFSSSRHFETYGNDYPDSDPNHWISRAKAMFSY